MAFSAAFSRPPLLGHRLLRRLLYQPVPRKGVRVAFATYGLRKLEAKLIEAGFDPSELAIVHPDDLEEAVSSETRILGVSSNDPLGAGFVSTTYAAMCGFGEPMTAYEFRYLMQRVADLRRRYHFTVVVGGAGSWQLLRYPNPYRKHIDCIVLGEGEGVIADLFSSILRGERPPPIIEAPPAPVEEIPAIQNPALWGGVQITRGCGRGCQFCSPTQQLRRDFPLERILQEVEVNIRGGSSMILVITDDVFLYHCYPGFSPNRDALLKLFSRIASVPGVRHIQICHSSLPPVLLDRKLVAELCELLIPYSPARLGGHPILLTEIGIETGSTRLIRKYMLGKPKPFPPEKWPDVVEEALRIMNDHDWCPVATILIGLPGETEEDAIATLELIDRISDLRVSLIPVLFVPEANCALRDATQMQLAALSDEQLEVFAACWRQNIRLWGPQFLCGGGLFRSVFRFALPYIIHMLYYIKHRRLYGSRIKRTLREIADAVRAVRCVASVRT